MARLKVSKAREGFPDVVREEMDRIDIEDARAALKEAKEKGTIPLRDLMQELGE